MAEYTKYKQNSSVDHEPLSLLIELQHLIYEIARNAELADKTSFSEIQAKADHALKILNSCILSKQVENGQTSLDLSPYGLGSIMHDAAYEISLHTKSKVEVVVGVNQPAMTNAEILKNSIYSAGNFIYEAVQRPLTIRSYTTKKEALGIGVFSEDLNVTPEELRKAISSANVNRMAMPNVSGGAGIMLLLADSLAKSIGSGLKVKKLGKSRGFSLELPKSDQLSLTVG